MQVSQPRSADDYPKLKTMIVGLPSGETAAGRAAEWHFWFFDLYHVEETKRSVWRGMQAGHYGQEAAQAAVDGICEAVRIELGI